MIQRCIPEAGEHFIHEGQKYCTCGQFVDPNFWKGVEVAKTETYQVFCPMCWRKFEGASLDDAVAKCKEHEKEHPTVHDYRCWHVAAMRGEKIEDKCTCNIIYKMEKEKKNAT